MCWLGKGKMLSPSGVAAGVKLKSEDCYMTASKLLDFRAQW